MKYELKGKYFKTVMRRAQELSKFMDVIMENGKVWIQSNSDYYFGLELLKNKKLIDEEEYRKELKVLYQGIYKEKQEKQLKEEDYEVLVDEQSTTLYNKEQQKYLSFVRVPKKPFDHYMIIAKDKNMDRPAMDSREIPFIIRKTSPIYENINSFYLKNRCHYIFSEDQDVKKNHIRIDKDEEDNYRIVVVKHRDDLKFSNERKAAIYIGDAFSNDNYLTVDSIFHTLSIKDTIKKMLKKIR